MFKTLNLHTPSGWFNAHPKFQLLHKYYGVHIFISNPCLQLMLEILIPTACGSWAKWPLGTPVSTSANADLQISQNTMLSSNLALSLHSWSQNMGATSCHSVCLAGKPCVILGSLIFFSPWPWQEEQHGIHKRT